MNMNQIKWGYISETERIIIIIHVFWTYYQIINYRAKGIKRKKIGES